MFERITIDSKNKLQYGTLCESLLFYQNTVLLLDYGSFPAFLQKAGYEIIEELVSEGDLKIDFLENNFGVMPIGSNQYMISTVVSDKTKKSNVLEHGVLSVYGKNKNEAKILETLDRCIGVHNYSVEYRKLLSDQILDVDSLSTSIQINSEGKLNREDITLEVKQVNDGIFYIKSNSGEQSIIHGTFLITLGTGEIYNTSKYNSALAIRTNASNYIESKVKSATEAVLKAENQIQLFHSIELPEHYDLRTTMEADHQRFQDLIELLRQAKKFKVWLAGKDPDASLLKEYYKEIKAGTWLEKLPPKSVRFIFFTGAGLVLDAIGTGGVATISGLGIGIFDEFIVDKILKQWKPDQFIDGEYKDFLQLRKAQ